jgi:TolA-binding protein
MTPNQQAELLLNGARRAYNERNYPFATARFREYLQKFPGHKEANSGRYALALCLLEGPDKNFTEAIQLLQPLAGDKTFNEQPYAQYYLGHCQRGLGVRELATAIAKPAEANQRRQEAGRRFDEASRSYAAAAEAFIAKVKKLDPPPKELSTEAEWASRARCDQAEMLLRTQKTKEARDIVAPFLNDAELVKSRYRRLGLYYHGFASVLLKDNLAAGKSLGQLTPFSDPIFGTHACYLLSRVHHLDGERAEATAQYQAVLDLHTKQVKEAQLAIRNPQAFKDEPDERARLQALATSPPPDHYARALLYLGVLHYEDGKFNDALTRLTEFEKQVPNSPLAAEVHLRIGFCQVQLKSWADALKTLAPIVDKNPELADQALLWMAKAQSGAADPGNQPAYIKAQQGAVDTLRRAIDRAKGDTAEVKSRRGLIMLELSDVQQLALAHKDAATTLNQLLQEKLLPQREEEIYERQVAALHLAGDYAGSDAVCVKFRDTFPKSTLLPAVLFRHAENAAFAALAAEKNVQLPDRVNTLAKLNEETIKRYQVLIDRFPEHPQVNLARYGLAMGHYRKGDVEKASTLFEGIPAAERNGELSVVPYVLADCLIRLAPTEIDDALAAGKLTDAMTKCVDSLNAFVGASPNASQAPDAFIKLGYCYIRLSEVQAMPAEKAKVLASARAAYEQMMQRFPNHELRSQAVFERARVIALQNDIGGAMNELRRFTSDQKLKDSAIAPMALLRLSALLRSQNQAAQAADVLDKGRQAYEANLAKDPARAAWVALLQYHHGLALKEAGKLPEARQVFDLVVKNNANRPEAIEAGLRYGQTLKDEGLLRIDAARKLLAQGGRKPEQIAEDRKKLADGFAMVGEAVKYLEARAEALKTAKPDAPARARMLYDAAWAARALADTDVETTREKIKQEKWQKMKDDIEKKLTPGQKMPVVLAPEVTLSSVPVQESEKKVRALYKSLIDAFPDLESSTDARFELAELMSEREEHDAAIKQLQEALDKEPPAELTERIKLRLGVCQAAKGDTKAAQATFQAIARNERSPNRAQAVYRLGEVMMQMKDYASAEKELKMFRDFGPFQNVPGLTDRALLRLGHALGQQKQWDTSRQVHEQVAGRFPQSPWVAEARYGIGWAHQNKNEFDQAVNAYNQVTAATASELGARAQLNIGICRLSQKKYAEASTALLVIPFTYDYPDLSALALLEAARAMAEDKQRDKAISLLKRLLRDHPDSESAKAAKERLVELEKS